jgi:uncharacterized glyoxalase superfamily protein PhnB
MVYSRASIDFSIFFRDETTSLNTYLNFEDNCRVVFELYRSIFGGELETLLTFREGADDMDITEVADTQVGAIIR